MYLISLYFDKKTDNRIRTYIQNIAEKTGNTYMVDHDVPPHITLSAFEICNENLLVDAIDKVIVKKNTGMLQWIGIGVFKNSTIFIQPILNEYLHDLSCKIYESIINLPGVKVSKYYKPFSWLPHTTIAKQLSEQEMQTAFPILSKSFGMFEGDVVRIELAKKSPYRELASWDLKQE